MTDHMEFHGPGEQANADAVEADSFVGDQVQERVDAENAQGFRGVEVDPTPNENYTLQGVTSGLPTPETDPEAAEKARVAQLDAERGAAGVGEK